MKESILVINKTIIKTTEKILLKNNFIVYTAEKETTADEILKYANISLIIYKVQPNEILEACEIISNFKNIFLRFIL